MAPASSPVNGDKKVDFMYDYLGRRVRKQVSTWTTDHWQLTTDQFFIYDGWQVVVVLDGLADPQTQEQVVAKYTWGLDLSSTRTGAGGIGGLLAAEEPQAEGESKKYWYLYDGNGNVGQLLRYRTSPSETVTLAAHYEYDPYGNTLIVADVDSSGLANDNPIRFSTKWLDDDLTAAGSAVGTTGMYYFGYRYYAAALGRWISRDPIGEAGGENMYQAMRGNAVSNIDAKGLCPIPRKGEVRFTVTLSGSEKYFDADFGHRELAGGCVGQGTVAKRFLTNPCCPAIGVVQMVHENKNKGGFGAYEMDLAGTKLPPFYVNSNPLPPAVTINFNWNDEPGWDPAGSFVGKSFSHEFITCVVCARNVNGAWKPGCILGCVKWEYSYSKLASPVGNTYHSLRLWVRGCAPVRGLPTEIIGPSGEVERRRFPTLRCNNPHVFIDSTMNGLLQEYR